MHDAKLYNYYRTFECEMFPLLGADEVSKKEQMKFSGNLVACKINSKILLRRAVSGMGI